jgi:SlyX protein
MSQSNKKSDNIIALESKVAYLEYNMENLNSEILDLRQTVDKQKIIINFLVEKLKGIQDSNIADRSEETPPPHY